MRKRGFYTTGAHDRHRICWAFLSALLINGRGHNAFDLIGMRFHNDNPMHPMMQH
jgi:hypothetical protein